MTEVLTQQAPTESEGLSLDRARNPKPMISAAQIARRVHRRGKQISEVYADIDTPLVIVVILKGATVFAADLLRSLSIPAELEFVRASSYPTGTEPGRLNRTHRGARRRPSRLACRRHQRLGVTVNAVARRSAAWARPRSGWRVCRPAGAPPVAVNIDFTGFVIPDRFVIGYGLDYAGLYRALPHIYALT
jgi:hypoxanthine phosphoribosyltransferase